jgi:hypothetical protein
MERSDGRFLPGHRYSEATQFKPGEHRSAATEFKAGQAAHNKLPVGSVTVRVETNTGAPRAWVKVAEPRLWRKRAVVVWERENGRALARGMVVHHRDRDSLNDAPENLVALTRRQHAAEHEADLKAARAAKEAGR